MTLDYYKFNQVLTPTEGSVPDVVSLLEQINTSSGIWYTANDLANAFFSTPVNKDYLAFDWQAQQYTFTVLTQEYVNSPTLCHIQFAGILITFHLYKIAHWSITLMALCWLDLVSKK